MVDLPQYLKDHQATCESMGLLDLLDQALSEAPGDDWDGCFTSKGARRFDMTCEVLRRRLSELISATE